MKVYGDRAPVFGDMKKLERTRDVFREALRLYPPVAFYARDAAKREQFSKMKIVEPGSVVFVSPWLMQRHSEHWDDPHAFDPDRFDTPGGQEALKCAYLPFSMGPRVCAGASFALQEATLLLERGRCGASGSAPCPATRPTRWRGLPCDRRTAFPCTWSVADRPAAGVVGRAMALKLDPGQRLVAATHNPGKAKELAALMDGCFDVVSACALGLAEPEETEDHLRRQRPDQGPRGGRGLRPGRPGRQLRPVRGGAGRRAGGAFGALGRAGQGLRPGHVQGRGRGSPKSGRRTPRPGSSAPSPSPGPTGRPWSWRGAWTAPCRFPRAEPGASATTRSSSRRA